jgi:WXXGXW repeat (2 copies)
MIRKTIAVTLLAATLGGTILPAFSAVVVRVAPPAPREEVVPAARPGYVWRGGYWDYRGNKHQWTKGAWVRERRGYHYVQPAWEEGNGRWTMRPGTWRRGDS